MARNTENTGHQNKKQKVTHGAGDSRKRVTNVLPKSQKKKILRRISSGGSSTDNRRRKAPVISQPGRDSPSPGRDLARPAQRRPRDSDDEEDDSEDEEVETTLDRLDKLPNDQRYTAIGKMFALKIWPWAPSSWWIGDEEVAEVAEASIRNSSQTKVLALQRKHLEAKVRGDFKAFLFMNAGILAEEWKTTQFRSQVTFYVLLHKGVLTIVS